MIYVPLAHKNVYGHEQFNAKSNGDQAPSICNQSQYQYFPQRQT